jgi:hypothetical protein
MNSLHFGGDWSPLAGFAAAAVLALGAFLLYRRETRYHASPLSGLLPWLRAGAVFLVTLMLAGPVIRHRQTQGTLTRLFFCVDGSESMGLSDVEMEPARKEAVARALNWVPPSRPAGGSPERERELEKEAAVAVARFDRTNRSERVRSLLFEGGEQGLIGSLAGRFDIQLLALENSGVRLLWESVDGVAKLPPGLPDPSATSTDLISSGMRKAVSPSEDAGNDAGKAGQTESPSAAVILFSDGQHNAEGSPIALARELGDRHVPVYTVGYGAAVPVPDLAVLSVDAPDTVFFEDRVSGTVVLKDDMPPGQNFRVSVETGGKVVWEKLLVTSRRHLVRVPFDFPVAALVGEVQGALPAGERRSAVPLNFEAKVEPLAGERESRNNTAEFLVRATSARRKILLLDGRPRWDSLYVRNLFQRDSRWQMNALILGGADPAERWPRGEKPGMFPSRQELLDEYDAVIVGDLPPRALSEQEWQWLADFVAKRGGGLLFVDGQRRQIAAQAASPGWPLAALLPVAFGAEGEAQSAAQGRFDLAERGRLLSFMALDPGGADPGTAWRQLRAPHWVPGVRALPGSETLLELEVPSGRMPALVWRQFGAGRVAYLAFDETWRWRADVAEKYQERFWNQLIPAIAEPVFAAEDERLSLETDRFRYQVGGTAEVRVRVREALAGRDGRQQWRAVLSREGRRVATVALATEGDRMDLLRGRTAPLEAGSYSLGVERISMEGELPLRVSFAVGSRAVGELAELSLNEELLKRVAEESGGKYLREEFSGELRELLSPLETGRVVETETVLWQSYWWFSAVLLFLSIEWILRKRLGLV